MADFDQKILGNLQDNIRERFRIWSFHKNKYRRYHFRISIALLSVTSLNAVVVGLSNAENASELWSTAAIVMAGVILFANGIQSLVNAGDMYSQNAKALNSLVDIQIRLEARIAEDSLDQETLSSYVEELRKLERDFFDEISEPLSAN